MKKLILVMLLMTAISHSQTWKYESGGSDFDGKFKTSYVQGVGSEFPYNKPLLAINKFDSEDDINFYISGAGYFQEGTNTSIKFVFDNEPEVIYSAYSFSYSADGKILFLTKFNDPNSDNKISKYEFINKLKTASKISIRTSDNYGSNDLSFSLRGSTKAINFVIPKEQMDSKIQLIIEERIFANDVKAHIKREVDKLLEIAKNEKLSESSITSLRFKMEDDIGAGELYQSLKFKPSSSDGMFESYGYVDIFYLLEDGSEKEITGTFTVEMDSPIFKRIEEEKIIEEQNKKEEQNRIKNLLVKYKIVPLQELMLKEIISNQRGSSKYSSANPKWDLRQLSNVTGVFSKFQYGKVWDLNITLHLDDNQKREIKIYISKLEISKKDLKGMGAKLLEEF